MAQYIIFNTNTKSDDLILEHWWVEEGDVIHHDQQVASIRDGDRIYLLRTPHEGILYEKYFGNNEGFNKKEPLAKIISKEEAGNIKVSGKLSDTERKIIASIHDSRPKMNHRVHIKATPSARRKARKHNVDLAHVTGTGPNGRIQLRDVTAYIAAQQPAPIKVYKNKSVKYGLPLTGLARRMARQHNIDVSKIPAPPDAHRIQYQDVERYINNPEGAVEEIEREYNIHEIKNLEHPVTVIQNNLPVSTESQIEEHKEEKEEQPPVIRLTTEEPNVIPTENSVIELPMEDILALGDIVNRLLLSEPSVRMETVIKLPSEEESTIPSGEVILLGTKLEDDTLKLLVTNVSGSLNEPKAEEAKVIRLYTEEPEAAAGGETIELTGEVENTSIEKEAKEKADQAAPAALKETTESPESSNNAHLSTYVYLDLLKLVEKYKPATSEIGSFIKNYILSVIYSVYQECISADKRIYYIPDIKSNTISYYESNRIDEIKEEIAANLTERDVSSIEDGNLVIIELLAYNLSSVAGLINPKEKIVLYLTYIKDLGKFFTNGTKIRNILKLSLDFDTDILNAEQGIEFIEKLRERLEELEVQF